MSIDIDPKPPTNTAPSRVGASVMQFTCLTGVVLIGVAGAAIGLYQLGLASLLSIVLFGVIFSVVLRGLITDSIDQLGPANCVTTVRAGLVTLVAGAMAAVPVDATLAWIIFVLSGVAFAMDGLDGYLARRTGTATPFGARYDMEIDALFGAVLSLTILVMGHVGPEILLLGFMRYGFVGAGVVWPWLNDPLPESFRRKAVCVIQIAALIALICPIVPTVAYTPIAWIAVAALVWSFAADTLWLMRAAV